MIQLLEQLNHKVDIVIQILQDHMKDQSFSVVCEINKAISQAMTSGDRIL